MSLIKENHPYPTFGPLNIRLWAIREHGAGRLTPHQLKELLFLSGCDTDEIAISMLRKPPQPPEWPPRRVMEKTWWGKLLFWICG